MSKSSYQARLNEIKYLEQRGKELEAIIEIQAQSLCNAGLPYLPSSGGISGDLYITDVNSGEFCFQLSQRIHEKKKVAVPLSLSLAEAEAEAESEK